jgi:hypothetical protein
MAMAMAVAMAISAPRVTATYIRLSGLSLALRPAARLEHKVPARWRRVSHRGYDHIRPTWPSMRV